MRDVRWCVTVFYQQRENGNRANQIHGFTIGYGKFKLMTEAPSNVTNSFSNENGAVLLRLRLSSTLQRRKRSPKTEPSKLLSRVERFENDAFWKRCFLVWTKITMLSENGDVIKIDMTGRQTTRSWLSKMADRCYHVASISRQFRWPIYRNAHASSSFQHAHWGYKSVFKKEKRIRRCSLDGENDTKTISVDANLFENGAVWTGP